MSHLFGDLLSQHLHRKHGLSQAKLAAGILQDPAIVGKMCKGQRLVGSQARDRVLAVIRWLNEQAALVTLVEANTLLDAACMSALSEQEPHEAELIKKLRLEAASRPLPYSRPSVPRTNLPAQLTSFIGREHEMAEVQHLIEAHRLVTLTGAGGVGKTRLAIETGLQMLAAADATNLPDGVWLVEVASLTQAALVPQAIARAFGLVDPGGRTYLDVVKDYLRDKCLVLIVDNCEHLIEACAQVIEQVLQHCWQVRILATSREGLRVPGERVYGVPSLDIPQPSQNSLPKLLEYASAQLFVERVLAARPWFAVQPHHVAPLAQICHHLNGIPLAIELAASLSETLALDEMAAQLTHHLALLVNPSRTTTPRHRTMQGALDWSYKLLVPAEQHLLARLSVFLGGWTVEAATAVCAGSSAAANVTSDHHTDATSAIYSLPEAQIPSLLHQLVRKSLVLVEPRDGQMRYRMLEPIRQFAQEQLAPPERTNEFRRRHAAYFLSQAEQTEAVRDTREERLWLPRLERERDNLRAVLQWAIDFGEAEFAQRLNVALFSFWLYCSGMTEANHWIAATQTLISSTRTPGSIISEAKALGIAGYAAVLSGHVIDAKKHFERSLALFVEANDERGIATSLRNLGYTAMIGDDLAPAYHYAERSLIRCRETRDPWGLAWSLYDLGYAALTLGELSESQRLLEEALVRLTEAGIQYGVYRARLALGHVMRLQNQFVSAEAHYRGAFTIQRQIHYMHFVADGLEGIAGIATAGRQPARAIRLFAAAQVQRDFASTPRWPFLQRIYDHDLAAAQAQLAPAAWASAWDEGKAMTLEQGIAYALGD